MPLNFPTGPTNGQIYENYRWSSTVGAWQSLSSGAAVTMSETAPVNAFNGQLWFNETEGKMYVSYYDGTSTQWVSAIGGLAAQTGTTGDLLTYDGTSWVASSVNNALGAGKILQVVSATKTDTFSSTATTYTDVTGLSVSITPTATTSKILVVVNYMIVTTAAGSSSYIQLVRNSTAIGIGDASGSRVQVTNGAFQTPDWPASLGASFLDSPNTTSATTYKVQGRNASGGTFYINRSVTDADSNQSPRGISTITAIEVAG